jgi:hypothetical protein
VVRKDWIKNDETFASPLEDEFEEDYEDRFRDVTKEDVFKVKDDTPANPYDRDGEFVRVGNGDVTNPDTCGQFRGYKGCLNVDLHNIVTLEGHNHKGEVYVKKRFYSCDKPTCPVCFKFGWAVREATNVESRIREASRKYGLAEHVTSSVPQNDYGLSFKKLRAKQLKILKSRYVHGGVLIFHAQRYANFWEAKRKRVPQGWYFSPHFHIIGFVDGGYSKCRKCENMMVNGEVKYPAKCMGCKGFEGQTRRMWEKEGGKGSGYIVKVLGKRKSVFGTAWYQLNHASLITGGERSQVATWFGTCSYRKLKLKKEDRIKRDVCPICGYDLVKIRYVGKDFEGILSRWWEKEFFDKFKDRGGALNWVPAPTAR